MSRSRPARSRAEGGLDDADKGVLVRKFRIVVVDQHRGIDLEDNEIPAWIEPAVDAEIIEPDALAHHAQRLIMPAAARFRTVRR